MPGSKLVVFVVSGRPDPAAIPALCESLRMLVVGEGADLVLCEVGGLEAVGLEAIDALARLLLEARRLGCQFQLANPCDRLVRMISLCGLERVMPHTATR